ncbi:tannase/feruloyl esterase family alpha/beta hydrolase [Aquamicrobium zhengzhouense]|uniref:tannase/feruloyl esterase family alpha/beta hydrolase n=1 Tax=Aquamicrobium zhengzhouense TaxID=2781738 RepID=UPI003898F8AC
MKLAHLQSSGGFYKDGGAGWVSPELAVIVTKEVYAQCDPLDGVEDGWIANFEGCSPDLSSLLCEADNQENCLTQAQIDAVNNVARPVELEYEIANGLTGHSGYPWGNVAWQGSFAGSRPQPSTPAPNVGGNDSYVYGLGDGYHRFMIAQDAEAVSLGFDPNDESVRDRIVEVSSILDATNPDLSPLHARNGKLILYAGGASEVPPAEVAAYWKRVLETVGEDKVAEFSRFYIFPSINHGGVGPEGMPNQSDLFSALEAWVETGEAPGELINQSKSGEITRPLCQYPTWPQYQSGDVNAASSFKCVN